MSIKITAIPAPGDNYIWCLANKKNNNALIIDPGKARPVLDFLSARNLNLKGICITHHHLDHTGGVDKLLGKFKIPVYGPAGESVAGVSEKLTHNTTFAVQELGISLKALETPGHTKGHLVFLGQLDGTPVLFSGDTLFSSGCGRVFEGSYLQMYKSLLLIRSLPDNTLVYSGHEYTLDNLQFALALEPDNKPLKAYARKVKQLREQGYPSVPTTLGDEKLYNPFFRCSEEALALAAAQHTGSIPQTEVDVFTLLRKWKNRF